MSDFNCMFIIINILFCAYNPTQLTAICNDEVVFDTAALCIGAEDNCDPTIPGATRKDG